MYCVIILLLRCFWDPVGEVCWVCTSTVTSTRLGRSVAGRWPAGPLGGAAVAIGLAACNVHRPNTGYHVAAYLYTIISQWGNTETDYFVMKMI